MSRTPLRQLGRYRILRELGQGAMGVVYLAEDELIQRQVALKTMQLPDEPEERAHLEGRFRQEAKAAGGLNHPNIITVHDLGREGEWLYIAMELLQGEELRELMTQGRLTLQLAVDLAAQVATGLAAAHQRGVIHRDIKPSNIMVLAGQRAKIMDFGVARMQASEVRTQTGLMLGSPKYMSPEQVEGRAVDHRTDIFSLGSMLYEMIAAAPPFNSNDLPGLLAAIAREQPEPPSRRNDAIPPALDRIVARAMAKRADDRYQDAGELAHELLLCAAELAQVPGLAAAPAAPLAQPPDLMLYGTTAPRARIDSRLDSTAPLEETAGPRLSDRFESAAALQRVARRGWTADRERLAWVAGWVAAALCGLWIALG
jgi:serine/threonine protein kinase